jgi:putative methyltransferase (TIGR04325 family)
MSVYRTAQFLRNKVAAPLVRSFLSRMRRERFLSADGAGRYHGVFSSFADARRHLPCRGDTPGFEQAPNLVEYVGLRSQTVFAYDYPVMWWLQRAFERGAARVLDVGGSVGVHYYSYGHFISMPRELAWHIVEVPAIVAIGRELAIRNGAGCLSFSGDLDAAVSEKPGDIWLSAGALQYIEDAWPDRLIRMCSVRPKHLLFNKLPLYSGDDFVTIQNVGDGSFVPTNVFNGARFIETIEAIGYRLVDKWDVHERSMFVPDHPERSFPFFSGLCFEDSSENERD